MCPRKPVMFMKEKQVSEELGDSDGQREKSDC